MDDAEQRHIRHAAQRRQLLVDVDAVDAGPKNAPANDDGEIEQADEGVHRGQDPPPGHVLAEDDAEALGRQGDELVEEEVEEALAGKRPVGKGDVK